LFIEIPLKRSDRDFEVFKPHSLPYYDNECKEFISIRNFKDILLAVSRDRQRVTTSNNSLWIYAVSLSARINKQSQAPSPVPEKENQARV
jgi:hypothetical protein